jgi:hypothetical protein
VEKPRSSERIVSCQLLMHDAGTRTSAVSVETTHCQACREYHACVSQGVQVLLGTAVSAHGRSSST